MNDTPRQESPPPPAPLVWVDLETSGLHLETCHILEVAVLITDGDLRETAEGPDLVIHQPDAVLDAMDEWCTNQHGGSGLTAAVKASTVSLLEAEDRLLAFLAEHCPPGTSPLCGNSVHFDRRFLAKFMPRVEAHLHYRNIDVSTIKELVRRWYPELPMPQKPETHRAMDDIRASIEELRYYREQVFR